MLFWPMSTAPPTSNYPRPDLAAAYGPVCPQCNTAGAKKVRYTWWGGVIGPNILSLHKCPGCGFSFNGKTGAPAMKGIIIYNVVVGAISLPAVLAIVVATH